MSSSQTKHRSARNQHRSALAIGVGLLLALTSFSTAADAATARKASLRVSPSLQYVGSPVTFSGNVSRSGKNAVVKIQRKSGSTWVAAGQTRTTTTTGTYSLKLNLPSTAAVYTYRTLAPKTAVYAGVYSPTVTVTALRRTTATIAANPTTVPSGSPTTLSGTVSPFVTGTTVTLQTLSGGTWTNGPTTTVSASGAFSRPVTPGATTTYRVAVPKAGLNAGTASGPVTVTVGAAPSAPTITTTTLPEGDKGIAYSAQLAKTGGDGTWSVSAGVLPAGITLAPTTGLLSGTPTAGGTSNFTVRFAETGGLSDTQALTLVVSPPPAITTTSLPDVTRGVAYSTTLTKTGRPGTWSISGLPAGLSINATTGEISGTTSAATGTYGVYPVFTETTTGRSILKAFALEVVGTDLAITTTTLPDATKGVAYSKTLTKTGGAGTWSSLALPAGLTLNPTTGELAGTPTVFGDFAVYVTFTETVGGATANGAFALHINDSTVNPPGSPTITTTELPQADKGVAYSTTLAKTGADGTWSKSAGDLPAGISLNPSTGVLSGTPTAGGTSTFTVKFTETASTLSDTQVLTLVVTPPPTVSTTSLPDATRGAAYSATLTSTGKPGTWAITGLPEGLSLNAATGAITGVPTTLGDYGVYPVFTETSTGRTATKVLSIKVVGTGLAITTSALPDATKGVPYNVQLTKTGGDGTWASLELPDGLSLNATTGVLSGTPTESGDFAIFVGFTETATSKLVTKGFALHIETSPVVTTTSLPDGLTGTAYSQQLQKTGADGTWSIVSGTLPTGTTLTPAGLLAGTPTAAGDFSFIVRFTETTSGFSDTQQLLVHVDSPTSPVITTTVLPGGTVGTPYSATLAGEGSGTWLVSYGFLPSGLDLNGTTGEIFGTPTEAGTSFFQVRYTTAAGQNTRILSITVAPAPPAAP